MFIRLFNVFGIFFVLLHQLVGCMTEKVVRSQLTTEWFASPLVLETSEHIQKFHSKLYWPIIEAISNKLDSIKKCHLHEFNIISEVVERFLSPVWLDYYKLVISRHDYAPRVHLYEKVLENLNIDNNCGSSVFLVGKNVACDLDNVASLTRNYKQNKMLRSLFYKYPTFKNSSPKNTTIIYYFGHIGTSNFWNVYNMLKMYVEEYSTVDFVVVPYSKDKCSMKIGLSNFGMSLSIKRPKYDPENDSLIDLIQYKDNSIFSKWLRLDSFAMSSNQSSIDPGLNIERLISRYPKHSDELNALKDQLYESDYLGLYELDEEQIKEFALSFISYAKHIPNMEELADVVSNLPSHTSGIANTMFSDSFVEESTEFLKFLSRFGMNSGVYLNGQELENLVVKKFDKIIMKESSILSMLSSYLNNTNLAEIESSDWNQLLQSYSTNLLAAKRLTIKSSMVTWLNNLEKDALYSYWPNNIVYLFKINFVGDIPSVALNAYNLISFIDPMEPHSRAILQSILNMFASLSPVRLGLVINAKKGCKMSKLMASGFYFLATKNPSQATRFLIDVLGSRNKLNVQVIRSTFTKYSKLDLVNIHENSDPVNDRISEIQMDINDLGLKNGRSYFFLNGKMIDLTRKSEPPTRRINSETLNELFHMYNKFVLRRFDSVQQLISHNEEFLVRVNEDLIRSPMFLGDVEFLTNKTQMIELLQPIQTQTVVYSVHYPSDNDQYLTNLSGNVLIFANLDSAQGRQLVKTVVGHQSKVVNQAKFTFIFNENKANTSILAKLTEILVENSHQIADQIDALFDEDVIDSDQEFSNLPIYDKFNLKNTDNAIVWNNKIFKLSPKVDIVGGDVELLLEMSKIPKSFVQSPYDDSDMNPAYSHTFSNWLTVIAGKLPRPVRYINKLQQLISNFEPFVISYNTRESASNRFIDFLTPHMVALIDPLSENSPRIFAQLNAVYSTFAFKVTVILIPTLDLKSLPIDNYYRWCLPPTAEFDSDTGYMSYPAISFSNLPNDPLYTSNLNIPSEWMVQNTYSNCDMDNIYLKMSLESCNANYSLKYILIEGSSWYEKHVQPSSGIQYSLKDMKNRLFSDTLVMNNLGYFQLKADVGIYRISPKRTNSNRFVISSITAQDGSALTGFVFVDSFDGVNLEIIGKQLDENSDEYDDADTDPDHGSEGDDDGSQNGEGFFEKLTNLFLPFLKSHSSSSASQEETINIFSVATGSIYERFIRVMMLSVRKKTKKPVKFWLLRNYLSANFFDSVEKMAKKYDFQYDFVQYQWPKWLNDQKEKRRIIWGYKILFLDVMFPLHVKRIIFVDADQVVRSDLDELNKMNLGQAPYAYTPFCNDRPEIDHLRFWLHGYWRNLLRGKPYHISALYVVDLAKFRKMAVGDRLRAHYQSLSEDPNSLANLDQDLPNSMIHEIPIKSLPKEWLWCETWCGQSSKKHAKSIDLCGNPMTNESKWNSALRIIPEFASYDNEIEALLHTAPPFANTTSTKYNVSSNGEGSRTTPTPPGQKATEEL